MERARLLFLQFLFCLSGATLQDNEQRQTCPENVIVPSNLHAVLGDMSSKLDALQSKVEQLQAHNRVGQVAFSATLVESGGGTFEADTYTPLLFEGVLLNIGNAYNPDTGYFIAPVKGVYHFVFYIYGLPDAAHPTSARLFKNERPVVIAFELQLSGRVNPANGAMLLLEAGDAVSVQQDAGTKLYDDDKHHCTFSGHLLFPV